ncbi:von willebrand factor type A (vWA) domain was originally protein (macronuclear) [Tetrahymena thermophila SB210]|uniref:von willebrand factor type A (VWA) domain was originally protein n=1 Tax=Tetrahymena thermophila (strain SB210) TaxID=312017 RepID=Q22SJ7_TETTS|nr:von willebrand factor type A (vWA) domain was originally protein [Tetrahymena thermophila SB210]EAR87775.1 von willebrand factor type A (vWA) domain was originally protein [Tetrahymena thermophila SB210]|eukprot:XP_001008020.1 von willebrand factor type A (vWA) domain was originally protein [Tetrahymena thermophila SB210]
MNTQNNFNINKFSYTFEEFTQSLDELEDNENVCLPISLVKKNVQNKQKIPINQVQPSQNSKLTSQLEENQAKQTSKIAAEKQPSAEKNPKINLAKSEFQMPQICQSMQVGIQLEDFRFAESFIEPNQKQMPENSLKKLYDLEKNLTFEVKTLKKNFQFNDKQESTFPIMISVRTIKDSFQFKDDQKDQVLVKNSRPSIDLVCVINNSESMHGEKILNVKNTLLYLLEMLNSNDRLSLVLSNNNPTTLFDLKYLDEKNKQDLKRIINNISITQNTNITKSMIKAFNILQFRQSQNKVSSIFLLSDGVDSSAEKQIQNYISSQQSLQNKNFAIHSFGYGFDQDAEMINKICSLKNGNFYYIQNMNQVDQYFADVLGGTLTAVAQDITIEISLNQQDKNFQKYFSNCRVSKTYGEAWKCIKKDEIYQIKINHLRQGASQDFIMELTIPKQKVKILQDFERNLEVVKSKLIAIPTDVLQTSKIVKKSNLMITLFLQNEVVPIDPEIDYTVEINYLRVQAAQAIENAMRLSENSQHQQSELTLTNFLGKLENYHPKNQKNIETLKKEILDCIKTTQSITFSNQSQSIYNGFEKISNYNQSTQIADLDDKDQMIFQKQAIQNLQAIKAMQLPEELFFSFQNQQPPKLN